MPAAALMPRHCCHTLLADAERCFRLYDADAIISGCYCLLLLLPPPFSFRRYISIRCLMPLPAHFADAAFSLILLLLPALR